MSWTPTSCGSNPRIRLADPLFRMAPCGRASSPSTYGRLVTPGFAASDHLEQRCLALPWFRAHPQWRRAAWVRLSPSDPLDWHHGRHPMRGRGMREHRATPRLACSAAGEAHRGRVSCRTGPGRRDVAPERSQPRAPEARLDDHNSSRVGSVTPRSRANAGQPGLALAAEADGHRGPDRRAPVRCRRACWRSSPSASHRGSAGRS